MTKINSDRQKFQELLPMYVNKTLGHDEVAFVEHYLDLNPQMQSQLKLNEAIRESFQKQDEPNFDQVEVGWQKLYERIKSEQKKKKPWRFGALGFFGWMTNMNRWGVFSPAFGFIFALFIGQSIYTLNIQNEASKYRGIVSTINLAPHFKVTVNTKANFYALSDLLRKNGCSVVSGPTENGEIWIKLDEPNKSKQIKADMLNSGLVDEVISVSDDVE